MESIDLLTEYLKEQGLIVNNFGYKLIYKNRNRTVYTVTSKKETELFVGCGKQPISIADPESFQLIYSIINYCASDSECSGCPSKWFG